MAINNEIRFYLEKRKDKKTGELITKKVPINLFYSFEGHRLQFYTGYRIDKEKWDEKKMRVHKKYSEAENINNELVALEAKVLEIQKRAKVLGEKLSPNYFKIRLNGTKKEAKNSDLVWEYFEEYIASLKNTHAPATIKNMKHTRNALKKFCAYTQWSLTFDNTGGDFREALIDWCYNVKGYYNNYTGTILDKFKAFLSWAFKKGYTTDDRLIKTRKMKEFIEIIFLEYDEVIQFLNFEFEDINLHHARELYCLAAFTGLRYSDVSKLRPENVHEDHISLVIHKTKKSHITPLNKYSKIILDRNKGIHPELAMPYLDFSKINVYLRLAMEKAGLNRMVQIIHYKGAQRFEESKPLWQVATFHTGKKTFITNFIQRGGQIHTAMALTGNKNLNVFKRYYKFTETFKASEMQRIYGK